KNSS
ncbi:lipoprotein, putative, partial [Vibrio cholerae O1 str. EM-1546]